MAFASSPSRGTPSPRSSAEEASQSEFATLPLAVLRLRPSLTLISPLTRPSRVYLAYNPSTQFTAACKVISIASSSPAENEPPRPTRKELEKEVKVHRMLKHSNILEFLDAVLVEENSGWVPGLFVLLELAAGGDLFDKIGEWPELNVASPNSLTLNSVLCPPAPDRGISDDLAHYFFNQLLSGVVCDEPALWLESSGLTSSCCLCRSSSTRKVSPTEISSRRTSSWTLMVSSVPTSLSAKLLTDDLSLSSQVTSRSPISACARSSSSTARSAP